MYNILHLIFFSTKAWLVKLMLIISKIELLDTKYQLLHWNLHPQWSMSVFHNTCVSHILDYGWLLNSLLNSHFRWAQTKVPSFRNTGFYCLTLHIHRSALQGHTFKWSDYKLNTFFEWIGTLSYYLGPVIINIYKKWFSKFGLWHRFYLKITTSFFISFGHVSTGSEFRLQWKFLSQIFQSYLPIHTQKHGL